MALTTTPSATTARTPETWTDSASSTDQETQLRIVARPLPTKPSRVQSKNCSSKGIGMCSELFSSIPAKRSSNSNRL
eukprot:194637-Amphidinium_carterae.1